MSDALTNFLFARGGAAPIGLHMMAIMAAAPAAATPLPPPAQLTPHRAIYEMRLDEAAPSANVADIRGRLVFDLTGSPCSGYTIKTRLVTKIVDREGRQVLSDMRSSTWEDGAGKRFRFDTSQYLNNMLTEVVKGRAERRPDGKGLTVDLEQPKTGELHLKDGALFPSQHALRILKAAHQGEFVVQTDIYDGSDSGDKIFATTTIIGNPILPGTEKIEGIANGEALSGMLSWPVSVSYFDPSSANEGTPSYELAFRLYENGVSRKLHINYGEFSLKGSLSSLEFFEQQDCDHKNREKPEQK